MVETTDEQKIILRWKVVIPVVVSLLLISNTFTRIVSTIEQNTHEIQYQNEASKRRINNANKIQALEFQIILLKIENESDISKIRYLKGLQIIRILYDKTLSLDHHFSSVRTFSEINKMANPNQYSEFDKLKELVATKKDKKTAV